MNYRTLLSGLFHAALASSLWAQNEIGFVEKFALAKDREAVLEQLIPGSEEYYFYHALQAQNTRDTAKLKATMEQWAKRFPDSPQRKIIENREALLSYDATPQATLAFLKDRLHLEFHDERRAPDQKPNLPTALDPKLIARDVFAKKALENSDDLAKCEPAALERFVVEKTPLSEPQRRALLQKLTRPDLPGLLDLIAADLDSKESKGFGEFAIYKSLLPEQLDELAVRRPSLFDSEDFVYTRLRKFAPSEDADMEFDPAERSAWLDRIWGYARKLSPSFNSLKAQILYQRLLLDRNRGLYDRALFLEYLKLPRQADYVEPEYLTRGRNEEQLADLSADLSGPLLGTPAVGNDDWLVREYFLELFKTEKSWQPWSAYVRDDYLKPLFAEAQAVNGRGDAEKWTSLMTPAEFQELKDRVDLEFSPTNRQFYHPGDDVTITVAVKNAPKLIIKIYEINTLSFCLTQKRALNTDVSLDGLVANYERTVEYHDPPLRRIARQFDFPELKGRRGAWIIEFIGGGKSSRALVRKGEWSMVQQMGNTGDILTVLDEKHAPVTNATAWFKGRKFTTDEKTGRITIPFGKDSGSEPIVLADAIGELATLTNFEHHAENYQLDAQFHVDREQLLAGREAVLAVRADLLLNNTPIPSSLLLEPKLAFTATTLDGISTTREFANLKLDAARAFRQNFLVPERLASLRVTLSGKVESLSNGGEKKELSASREWRINGIDETDAVSDGHFSRFDKKVVFEWLGKNGEPVPNQAVAFHFVPRDFDADITVALQTGEYGRIDLGELPEIRKVEATMPNKRIAWCTFGGSASFPATIHATIAEKIQVPWTRSAPPEPGEVALLELRAESPVRSRLDAVKYVDGFLQIVGLSPGDYRLLVRGGAEDGIEIKVTAGDAVAGWIVGANRKLERPNPPSLHIQSVEIQPDALVVHVANMNPFARVHVTATRFMPEQDIFDQLGGFITADPAAQIAAREPNVFVSGRIMGDEYRYILERRYAAKFPGNMLTRPGLLLDPWEVRSTDSAVQSVSASEALSAGGAGRPAQSVANPAEHANQRKVPEPEGEHGPNLDFLATNSRVLYNLTPDAQGIIRIERKLLGDRQDVQIYAEDLATAEAKEIALPGQPMTLQDLRLPKALDPQKNFAEQKEVRTLAVGQTLTLPDILTSQLSVYDSVASVYSLFVTLSNDPTLAKFDWIVRWPSLKDEDKRAKYSEFACHELNFFLYRKDPEFFRAVVQPYLANKKDKTFLDEWLLGADLHRYLEPWAYAQLNIVERALLAQRIPGEAEATSRHLRELWELLPPDPERDDHLFETALSTRSMDGGGDFAARQLMAAASDEEKMDVSGLRSTVEKIEKIKQLFVEAKAFYDTGRLNLAYKRCDQILEIDPYNIAARKMKEAIERKRDEYAIEGYNETRSKLVYELDSYQNGPGAASRQALFKKIDETVIPKVSFRNATIQEALDFLHRKSVELDPEHTGVDIVSKFPSDTTASITVELSNIPLVEALKYVTTLAGLRFRVGNSAVEVAPAAVNTESLITREIKVDRRVFNGANPKDYLMVQGIQFPPGAVASFDPQTSLLTVRNTSDALELVDAIFKETGVVFPNSVRSELRSGKSAISQNAIDALLAGTSGASTQAPAGAPIAGISTQMTNGLRAGAAGLETFPSTPTTPVIPGIEAPAMILEHRAEIRQFYRKLGAPKEWAENNYYELPLAQQNAELIAANAFWRDYAAWDGKSPFLSKALPEASRNFTEMMFALAVLDLPFKPAKSEGNTENGEYRLTAAGPLIVYDKQIAPANQGAVPAGGELLVSESYFRQDDRYRMEGNEKFDKYVTGEFLSGVVYGANVVVTNPTSSPQKLEILLQIPQGAIAALGSKPTDRRSARLEAYSTKTFEYYFYFPTASPKPFAHYPVHISHGETFAGAANPMEFAVVEKLTTVDKTSWDYVSQDAGEDEVFDYLEKENLQRIDLARIAWRVRKSADFFHKLIAVLARRHVYNDLIYSYAVVHNDSAALAVWLRHRDDFLANCGPFLAAKLLTIDPVERHAYEHLEYSPLINQRAHRLGAENTIGNAVFRGQYQSLLGILAHKPSLDSADELSVVYYLFLQDRVEEALQRLAVIKPESLASRLQYDYLRCYADFYAEKLSEARGIAAQYSAYPVDRWRKLFADVTAQLNEIQGEAPAAPTPGAKPDREAQQGALAEGEPSFDFKVEKRAIALTWKNLPEVTINYYLMDPEFLFSSSPFVSEDPGRFSMVRPAKTSVQKLANDGKAMEIPLPQEFAKSNVLIEILGAGQRKAQAYHANSLRLTLAENYGRMELRDEAANKPLAKAYVKVYARLRNGQIRFFKDGYTDLRGKFDYASLNGSVGASGEAIPGLEHSSTYQMLRPSELEQVEKLALLVLSENNGDLVREVNPPSE